MKRLCFLLALIMVFSCAGCCYAPGYRGSLQIENWFEEVPTLPAEDYAPLVNNQQEATEGNDIISGEPQPIPDPEIDFDTLPVRTDDEFVNVLDYIPDLVVDLKYATTDNFTGKMIYNSTAVYLRYGTVKKLMEVQKELRSQGYLLKIWDGYRSVSAHKELWYAYPDSNYVADPSVNVSDHCRGNTVDVTVVNAAGEELTMPTGFDDFTVLADRDYSDCSAVAGENATMLQDIMEANGFEGYELEWWHYSDTTEYPVEEIFDPNVMALYYADCNEYITLRSEPHTKASAITTIPVNQKFTLLGYVDEYFCWVEYEGQRGYVLIDYIGKVY